MTRPVADNIETDRSGRDAPAAAPHRSNAPVVLRIIFAVVFMVPMVAGLGTLLTFFADFVEEGFRFSGADSVWMQIGIGAAAIIILISAIVLGAILRYARWRAAPTASLVLSIIVGGAGALASGMLQTTVVEGDAEGAMLLRLFSIAGVVIGCVPPFLHWWKARPES